MDNPTILYEAAKLHHGEIEKEMISWRMARRAKNAGPGLVKRLVLASKVLIKKMIMRQKHETYSPDDHLILNANS